MTVRTDVICHTLVYIFVIFIIIYFLLKIIVYIYKNNDNLSEIVP